MTSQPASCILFQQQFDWKWVRNFRFGFSQPSFDSELRQILLTHSTDKNKEKKISPKSSIHGLPHAMTNRSRNTRDMGRGLAWKVRAWYLRINHLITIRLCVAYIFIFLKVWHLVILVHATDSKDVRLANGEVQFSNRDLQQCSSTQATLRRFIKGKKQREYIRPYECICWMEP